MKKQIPILTLLFLFAFAQAKGQDIFKELNKAKTEFNDGKIDLALLSFQSILSENPELDKERYFEVNNLIGVCQLKLKDYGSGINTLNATTTYYDSSPSGDTSLNYYLASSQLATLYFKAKKWDLSEYLFKQCVAIKSQRKENKDVAFKTLNQNLAALYKVQSKYVQADSTYRVVLSIQEDITGKNDAQYLSILLKLGDMHLKAGNVDLAIPTYEDALQTFKDLKARSSEHYGDVISKLAHLYESVTEYGKAEIILQENIKYFKRIHGENSKLYLVNLINLADLYRINGNFNKSTRYYDQALPLVKSIYGEDSDHLATLYNNMAILSDLKGDYPQSCILYKKAIEICITRDGENSLSMATTLNNYAHTLADMGDFNEADQTYQKVLRIHQEKLGSKSPELALTLNNMAVFYQKLGRMKEAKSLLAQANDIILKVYGNKHIKYAHALVNMGAYHEEMGEHSEALSSYNKAYTITLETFGERHTSLASIINNISNVYLSLNKFDEASKYADRFKNIIRKIHGTKHPMYATSLRNLGRIYEKQGQYKKGLKYYEESLSLRISLFSKHSPLLNDLYVSSARCYEMEKNLLEAENRWTQVVNNFLYQIHTILPAMSEDEKGKFYQVIRVQLEQFYNFVVRNQARSPKLIGLMLKTRLATKAMLFNSSLKLKKQILASNSPELISLFHQWNTEKEMLAELYSNPGTSTNNLVKVDSLEKVINDTEKKLNKSSSTFDNFGNIEDIGWQDVQKSLATNDVAIEIIRVNKYSPNNGGTQDAENILYITCFINKTCTTPSLKTLSHGMNMENTYLKYYRNCILFKLNDKKSYQAYWKEIETAITESGNIFISPDGVYNQLNLNTLWDQSTESYFIDKYTLTNVTSLKDLTIKSTPTNDKKYIELFGGSDFSTFSSNNSNDSVDINKANYTDKIRLAPLPGSRTEVEKIETILSSHSMDMHKHIGMDASEEEIKKMNPPKILHIGTHGFFKKDIFVKTNDDFSSEGSINPLLQSGLYLSKTGKEDGVLYAYETMNLDLSNTNLVILSACETGLGEVKNGEGVYGLQRALKVAGADKVALSLWKVDDHATQMLMTKFYSFYSENNDIQKSFKLAQIELRKVYKHPFYWGAFVITGK